jgi:hypothetical protein
MENSETNMVSRCSYTDSRSAQRYRGGTEDERRGRVVALADIIRPILWQVVAEFPPHMRAADNGWLDQNSRPVSKRTYLAAARAASSPA